MIAALIIVGLLIIITLVILLCFCFGRLISGYKRFQTRDDSLDYAIIDYSTYKRLYQVNPDGYEFPDYGQLYRLNKNHGWTTREIRILFKTFKDYCQFIIDKKAEKKTNKILKRNQQEAAGLDKLRTLAQQDIDNLRAKLDAEFEQEKKKTQKIAANIRQPLGDLKPSVRLNGNLRYYQDKQVYVDELGYYFTKEGKPILMPWEEK